MKCCHPTKVSHIQVTMELLFSRKCLFLKFQLNKTRVLTTFPLSLAYLRAFICIFFLNNLTISIAWLEKTQIKIQKLAIYWYVYTFVYTSVKLALFKMWKEQRTHFLKHGKCCRRCFHAMHSDQKKKKVTFTNRSCKHFSVCYAKPVFKRAESHRRNSSSLAQHTYIYILD
jgi:hypothetical protein